MKLEIKVSYDVVIQEHRDEILELDFSIEYFQEYLGEDFFNNLSEKELIEGIYDYLYKNSCEVPKIKDNEELDYDSINITDITSIYEHCKHLINK